MGVLLGREAGRHPARPRFSALPQVLRSTWALCLLWLPHPMPLRLFSASLFFLPAPPPTWTLSTHLGCRRLPNLCPHRAAPAPGRPAVNLRVSISMAPDPGHSSVFRSLGGPARRTSGLCPFLLVFTRTFDLVVTGNGSPHFGLVCARRVSSRVPRPCAAGVLKWSLPVSLPKWSLSWGRMLSKARVCDLARRVFCAKLFPACGVSSGGRPPGSLLAEQEGTFLLIRDTVWGSPHYQATISFLF